MGIVKQRGYEQANRKLFAEKIARQDSKRNITIRIVNLPILRNLSVVIAMSLIGFLLSVFFIFRQKEALNLCHSGPA